MRAWMAFPTFLHVLDSALSALNQVDNISSLTASDGFNLKRVIGDCAGKPACLSYMLTGFTL